MYKARKIKQGDKVVLIHMPNDPNPIQQDSAGIVIEVNDVNIQVKWDNDRTLALIPGVDQFYVISNTSNAVLVPKTIYDQITTIKNSGKTNMFDVTAVMRIAYNMEYYDLVTWLSEPFNNIIYYKGVVNGFEPEND